VYAVQGQGTGEVATVVTKIDGTEQLEGVCRIEGDSVTVQINAGKLASNGSVVECPTLSFANELERHDMYYAGADDVNGTYQFVVDRPETAFRNDVEDEYWDLVNSIIGVFDCVLRPWLCSPNVYGDSPPGDDLYTSTSIYDVSVETTYRDDRISLTRNLTIPVTAR
jgi:hypothetical protein